MSDDDEDEMESPVEIVTREDGKPVIQDSKMPAKMNGAESLRLDQREKEVEAEPHLNGNCQSKKIGKPTDYDAFCGDLPTAPELIRRCLAVLRTVCVTSQASSFLNPVDPQANPGYYEAILKPICLREIGKRLYEAADKVEGFLGETTPLVEAVVAEFGRSMRLIEHNTLAYGNAGPTVIAMSLELSRIFERLFFDWVLAPDHELPPLDELDDEKCVYHHPSDEESTVLFCDGCESKWNIKRLDPPLQRVPRGDWYCPRCVCGRWWGQLDKRIGKRVEKVRQIGDTFEILGDAHILSCFFRFPDGQGTKPSLLYTVDCAGGTETWSLDEVDRALKHAGIEVSPIRCLEAVAESPGYRSGVDACNRLAILPVPVHPNISDAAAQVSMSSPVFRDTITASGALLVMDPREMTAAEWMRLLVLLTMKCSSSDVIQSVVSKMEAEAAETMTKPLEKANKVNNIRDILPDIFEDVGVEEIAGDSIAVIDTELEPTGRGVTTPTKQTENESSEPMVIASQACSSAHPSIVEAQMVEIVDELDAEPVVIADGEGHLGTPKATEVIDDRNPFFREAVQAKKKRRKAAEDSLTGYCLKSQLKPTVASFPEDHLSKVIDNSLSSKELGLDFDSLRCRRLTCSFCGLTDVALGSPLIRVPNDGEWTDLIAHAGRNRRVMLVAELPQDLSNISSPIRHSLVAVTVKVDGELISNQESEMEEIYDGGMTEFVPRSEAAFQSELKFRGEMCLPFITGCMSAHEVCAVAVHSGRKDLMIQRYKEQQMDIIEKQAGSMCGRTLEIGRDNYGRSYWQFYGDKQSLFVCGKVGENNEVKWHRFGDAASIASVIMCLRKEHPSKDLLKAYPAASRLLKSGVWSDVLLKRAFPNVAKWCAVKAGDDLSDTETKDADVGIKVLGGFVVSKCKSAAFFLVSNSFSTLFL
jgi:hypothetical protein